MKTLVWFIAIGLIIWMGRRSLTRSEAMSAQDAAAILDVRADASADEINAAHRRLIAKVHPDAGGSADLAKRVNEARDVLLRRIAS